MRLPRLYPSPDLVPNVRTGAGGSISAVSLAATAPAIVAAVTAAPVAAPPTLTYGSPGQGTVGQIGYSLSPSALTGTGVTVSLQSGTLPTGLSLNSATGAVTGNPSGAGTFSGIVLRATDSSGRYVEATISITVNAAPTIPSDTLDDGTEGEAYADTIVAVGGTGDGNWSVVSGALPTGGTLSGTGTKTATITVASPAAETASFTLRYTDTNGVTVDRAVSIEFVSADTFADIWAGSAQIFDLHPDTVTLAGSKADTVAGVGADTDCIAKQGTDANRATYAETDADFNGLPSLESSGSPIFMDFRNAANTADKLQSAFVGAAAGFMVAVVKMVNSSGNNANARDNAQIMGSSSAAGDSECGLSHRGGAAPKTLRAFSRDAANPFTIRNTAAYNLAANEVAVIAYVKTAAKTQLWVNGSMVQEVDSGNAYVADKMSIFKGENGAAGFFVGKIGPFAAGTTVPGDFADRMTATAELAGVV